MEHSARNLAAAGLIADTFAPGGSGVPSASELGVPQILLDLAMKNPREAERKQLDTLLRIWDGRSLGALHQGRPRKFSALSQAEREEFLLGLANSRIPQKRALFNTLRFGMLVSAYMAPGPTGHSPVWDALGWPAPPGVHPDAPAPALNPLRIEKDTVLTCDVVVVGSGAGGGTAAGVLAAAGLDVVVLEEGDYHDDRDFDGAELKALMSLYAPAPQGTVEGQLSLMAGAGLGGGTVVNYTTSFRTPDDVRAEWASLGAQQFGGEEYTRSLDAVCNRLGVNTDHDTAAHRDAIMERGLEKLGWHVEAMPRNVRGCEMGEICGRCGLGCRIGAKQSTAKTWLQDASDAGARLHVGVRGTRVLVEQGVAVGVEGRSTSGDRVVVKARAVVVAAGAVQTPALLKRSGLGNPNIGRHLRLHPVSVVWARYDEEVLPWTGAPQSRFSREHRDLDGKGYGVIYETAPTTPALAAGFIPWHGAASHAERMRQLRHLVPLVVINRDRDSGEVKVRRDGEPVVSYKISDYDASHLQFGIEQAARIAEAAGAVELYSCHQRPIGYQPGRRGSHEEFVAQTRAAGFAPGRCAMASLHIMGSARMGGSAGTSAVNPDGETWDVANLVVADGSCFPTASGVNPMISIESIAHMNASRLAARLA